MGSYRCGIRADANYASAMNKTKLPFRTGDGNISMIMLACSKGSKPHRDPVTAKAATVW